MERHIGLEERRRVLTASPWKDIQMPLGDGGKGGRGI